MWSEEKITPKWECWAEQTLLGSAIKSEEVLLISQLRELESCFSKEDAQVGAPQGLGWEPCPAPVLLHLGSFFGRWKTLNWCFPDWNFRGTPVISWRSRALETRAAGMKDVCEAGARLGLTQIFASKEGEVTRSIFTHIK